MKQSSYSIVRLLIYRNNVESIEAEFGFFFTFNRKLCSYRLAEKKEKTSCILFCFKRMRAHDVGLRAEICGGRQRVEDKCIEQTNKTLHEQTWPGASVGT